MIKKKTDLAHPNIVQFMGLCIELEDIYIVTEFVAGGDLRAILKDTSIEIGWDVRTDVIKQLAAAMNYLHSRNIIHRDLKSHNLLVADGWKIKVCDFGLARPVNKSAKNEEYQSQLMTIVGTHEWMAPEVMLGLEYDQKCDVFSYAMVMYEILTREKPPQRVVRDQFGFPGHEHKDELPSETPEELWDVLCECAERDPASRPEFKDITRKILTIQKKYDTDPEGWPETASQKSKSRKSSLVVAIKETSRHHNSHNNGVKKEEVVATYHGEENGKPDKVKKVKKVKTKEGRVGEKKKKSAKIKDVEKKKKSTPTIKKKSSSTTIGTSDKKVAKKKKTEKEV